MFIVTAVARPNNIAFTCKIFSTQVLLNEVGTNGSNSMLGSIIYRSCILLDKDIFNGHSKFFENNFNLILEETNK